MASLAERVPYHFMKLPVSGLSQRNDENGCAATDRIWRSEWKGCVLPLGQGEALVVMAPWLAGIRTSKAGEGPKPSGKDQGPSKDNMFVVESPNLYLSFRNTKVLIHPAFFLSFNEELAPASNQCIQPIRRRGYSSLFCGNLAGDPSQKFTPLNN